MKFHDPTSRGLLVTALFATVDVTSSSTQYVRGSSSSQGDSQSERNLKQIFPGISGLYNTGVDDDGVLLGDGANDTHYTLECHAWTTCSGCPHGSAFQCPSNPVTVQGSNPNYMPTTWEPNHADGRWIAPLKTGFGPDTVMVYKTHFEVHGCDLIGFNPIEINGQIAADNFDSEIMLGGDMSLLQLTDPQDFLLHNFTITIPQSELTMHGPNELRFLVTNDSFQTGLFVKFDSVDVTCACPNDMEFCVMNVNGTVTHDCCTPVVGPFGSPP